MSVLGAAGSIGGLHFTQAAKAADLAAREEQAVADSTRFAGVLAPARTAEAKRDSVLRQLEVIKSIDADRFVWPHVMDEISRALPPYTWLKTLAVATPQAAPGAQPAPRHPPTRRSPPRRSRRS